MLALTRAFNNAFDYFPTLKNVGLTDKTLFFHLILHSNGEFFYGYIHLSLQFHGVFVKIWGKLTKYFLFTLLEVLTVQACTDPFYHFPERLKTPNSPMNQKNVFLGCGGPIK